MWTRRFLICMLLAATALPVLALDRPFPESAQRGKMSLTAYPDIMIDGKLRRASHNLRIWNGKNRIERLSQLRGNSFIVNYTENSKSDIDRIWILTLEEIKQPLATQSVSQVR